MTWEEVKQKLETVWKYGKFGYGKPYEAAFLKAIEAVDDKIPRLLSYEEVIRDMPCAIWLESISTRHGRRGVKLIIADNETIGERLEATYGILWRAWSQKPDSRKRTETPWEKYSE